MTLHLTERQTGRPTVIILGLDLGLGQMSSVFGFDARCPSSALAAAADRGGADLFLSVY
jgi:hypothetical protein